MRYGIYYSYCIKLYCQKIGKEYEYLLSNNNERRELKTKDKTVVKMSRDGLVEENLATGSTKNVSRKEKDTGFSAPPAEQRPAPDDPPGRKQKPNIPLEAGAPPEQDGVFSSPVKYERESKLRHAENKVDKIESKLDKTRKKQAHKKKLKSKLIYDEQAGKAKRKLYFEDEPVVPKERLITKGAKKAGAALSLQAHKKIHQVEKENAGVEATHKSELAAEGAARGISRSRKGRTRKMQRRTARLEKRAAKARANLSYEKALKNNPALSKQSAVKKLWHKRKIQKEYIKKTRKQAEKGAQRAAKAATKIITFPARHPAATAIIIIVILLIFLFMSLLGVGTSMIGQGGLTMIGSTYVASDGAINQAELYYTELETDLYYRAYALESQNPGYDEYRYNIGEISHDPYVLMAYLNAKYHDFTFEEIKPELDALFAEQYTLWTETTTETRTETKTIQVGESLGMVVTSGYCNCSICCGQWAGGPTASGAMPKAGHTIAVDASNPTVPMGTKIVMGGIEYTVEDTGNFARYGVDFDIYFDSHATASNWGHRSMEAYLAEGNVNSVTVTKEVTVKVFHINVSAKLLPNLLLSKMDEEQYQMYSLYMTSKGNRFYFSPPFDFNWTYYVSSGYGWRVHPISGEKNLHEAVDIAATEGTPIKAVQHGKVTYAGVNGGYGNCVIIEDDEGLKSLYAHLSSISVRNGQAITRGDEVGKVGSTGNSTGPHLHLEVYKNGKTLNPMYFVDPGNGYMGGNTGYPGEAYDDETFQRLMAEATKYIGYPYVWGGSTPQTSFDCSGFVCWSYTQSGVYNLGRTNAQGIYNKCVIVTDPKPGDLVFFHSTYSTSNLVTHVAIYVGNGQMLHAGKPIGYANMNTNYWQSHFLCFGRLS